MVSRYIDRDRDIVSTCGNKVRLPDFSVIRRQDKLYIRADEFSSAELISRHKWITSTIHPDGVQDFTVHSLPDFRWKLKTVLTYSATLRLVALHEEDCVHVNEIMRSTEGKQRLYFFEINAMMNVKTKTIQDLLSGREADCVWIEKSNISAKECFNHETVLKAPEFVCLSYLRVEDEGFAEEIFRLKANWIHLDLKGLKITPDEIRLFIEDRIGNPRPEMFLGFHVDFPEKYELRSLLDGYDTMACAGFDRKNNARYRHDGHTLWFRWDKTHFSVSTIHDHRRERIRSLVWNTNQQIPEYQPSSED